MELYIHRGGEQLGPYSEDEVRTCLKNGTIQLSDLAWHEGASEWQPLSALGRFSRRSTPPPAPPRPPTTSAPRFANPATDLPAIRAESLGSYARSTLQPDEVPLYKTSVHWIVFVRYGIFSLLVLVLVALPVGAAVQNSSDSAVGWIGLLLPVLVILPALITYMTSELVITDKRVLVKVGFVQRKTLEMFISKIESVGVSQGIFGRICDYGTVTIRGTGGSAEPFKTIARPIEFRNCVQRIQTAKDGGR